MLRTLDPHSSFFEPRTYAQMRERQEGHYYGIGISIASIDGDITVSSLFEGSPAYRAGIRRGDIIAYVRRKGRRAEQGRRDARHQARRLPGQHEGLDDRRRRQAHQGTEGHDGRHRDPAPGRRTADRPDGRARRDQHHDGPHGVHDRAGHRLRAPAGLLGDDRHGALRRAQEAQGRGDAAADSRPARQPRRPARPGDRHREPLPAQGPDDRLHARPRRELRRGLSRDREGDYTDVPLIVLVNRDSASASEIVTGVDAGSRPRPHHRRDDVRQGARAVGVPIATAPASRSRPRTTTRRAAA